MATNDSNDGSKAPPRDEDPGGEPPPAAMPTNGSNALAPDGANGSGNPPTNTGENAATSYEGNKTFASVSNLAKSQGWTPPLEGTPGHNMGLMQAKTAAYTAVTKLIASYHVSNVGAFNKHSDNAIKNTIAGILAGYGFGPNSLLMKNALDTLQEGYDQDAVILTDQDEQAVTAKGSSVMEHSGTDSGSESLVAGVRPLRVAEGRSISPPKDKRTRSGSDTQTEAAVASPSDNAEKKAPIIDGAIFKDALTGSNVDYMADDPLNYEAAFGPDYELKGVVTHFTHIHSFLDPRVVDDDSPTALTATVEECAQDDTLVPNEYILGCTVGCAPTDVHLLTEHNMRTVAGAIAIGSVGPYKILAVYSGIDLSDWDNKKGGFTPQDVEADAKRQAEATAQFASLAVKTNMPLTLVLYGTKQAPIDVYEWAKSVLSRVPGWTKDRRILLTRVMKAVEDIEDFMCMFPHTTVEVTQPFLALASASEGVRLWITRVPWQKLGVASLTPILADQETGNNPADCVNVVNVLASWTGEDPHYIAESTARAVAFHYGIYAQKPRVFDNAPCLKAKVKKMNWVEYNNYLQRTYGAQSAGGGPEVKHPDALRDMRLPSPPVHAATAPEVEKQPVLAKQPAPLGAVHLQHRHGELRQTTVFTVDDETETGWEFVRQHATHPQAEGVRFHPIVSSVADEWKKHMVFTNPKDQKRVTRIGHAVIDCFGQVLLVVYATRWARKYADRVLAYLDQIMGTHDLATLERATISFTLYIIDREVQAYEEAEKAGNAPAERPNPDRCCLTPNDTYKAIRFWYCRCETAYRYFLANFSGNIAWFSTFMTSCQTPNVGNAFVANLQGQFAEQMNLARFKHYLEQVTKEINLRMGRDGRPVWPPIPTSYRVDLRRMYHSRTVVLVDDWAKQHFSQNIRKDIDVISLPADPTVAIEAVRQMFFCYTVKRLVLFYGKEAIDLSRSRALFDFYRWSSDRLSRLFGRIDVYFVHPPFSYFQRQPWRDATLSGLAENPDVNRYLTVVTYHLDLRLAEYYRAHPSSEWPAEALQEQTKSGTLTAVGVAQRKVDAVTHHNLDLWTDAEVEAKEPDPVLSDHVLLTKQYWKVPRHYGEPTVPVEDYHQRMEPPKNVGEVKGVMPLNKPAPGRYFNAGRNVPQGGAPLRPSGSTSSQSRDDWQAGAPAPKYQGPPKGAARKAPSYAAAAAANQSEDRSAPGDRQLPRDASPAVDRRSSVGSQASSAAAAATPAVTASPGLSRQEIEDMLEAQQRSLLAQLGMPQLRANLPASGQAIPGVTPANQPGLWYTQGEYYPQHSQVTAYGPRMWPTHEPHGSRRERSRSRHSRRDDEDRDDHRRSRRRGERRSSSYRPSRHGSRDRSDSGERRRRRRDERSRSSSYESGGSRSSRSRSASRDKGRRRRE